MRACWLLVLLGACGEGIFIEVRRPPGVEAETVELIVADEVCSLGTDSQGEDIPCLDGIRPEGFPTKVGTAETIFFRDATDPFAGAYGDSDTVIFQLSPGDRVLPVVVAVGKTNGVITSLAVMKTVIDLRRNPMRYVVDLEPAVPLAQNQDMGPRTAYAWPRNSETIDCLAVNGPEGQLFLVPDDDHDCDRVAEDRECDPLDYLAVTRDPQRCTTHNPELMGACTVGFRTCNEADVTTPADCKPEAFCVPDAMCVLPCESTDEACQAAELVELPSPRISCVFRGEFDGVNLTKCGNSQPAGFQASVANVAVCPAPPRFIDLPNVSTAYAGALDQLDLGETSFRVITHEAAPCKIELEFEGTAPGMRFETNLALEFSVVGETSATARKLLVPATFSIEPDCLGESFCTIDDPGLLDNVFACTR